MKKYLACASFLATFAAAQQPTLANQVPSIYAIGVASADAVPDKIDIHVELTSKNLNPETATQQIQVLMASFMAVSSKFSIAPSDVQLRSVAVRPQEEFEYVGSANRSKGIFHHITKQLVVCLRKTTALDSFLVELAKLKIQVSQIAFVSAALEEKAASLELEAIKHARQKASASAELLGVKLGRPLRVVPMNTSGRGATINATYSTAGGANVGAETTGGLRATYSVAVDFELIPSTSTK